jgi:hypothetical protein
MSLTVIVPTKGRPGNAARLLHAVNETAGDELERLIFAVDVGEPLTEEYRAIIPENGEDGDWNWARVERVHAVPQRMGPVLNALAVEYAADSDYLGFLGDDHLPQTQDWDGQLVAALNGRPGVAYGNDLGQGEKLPTACVISADIIRALGFMAPPGQDHLYLDDFWKFLGEATGNLVYVPDVVIEHLHPTLGKGEWDDGYAQNNDVSQYERDRLAYERFIGSDWPGCVTRLKDAGIIT